MQSKEREKVCPHCGSAAISFTYSGKLCCSDCHYGYKQEISKRFQNTFKRIRNFFKNIPFHFKIFYKRIIFYFKAFYKRIISWFQEIFYRFKYFLQTNHWFHSIDYNAVRKAGQRRRFIQQLQKEGMQLNAENALLHLKIHMTDQTERVIRER